MDETMDQNKFKRGKIYKLVSSFNDGVYIGSTTEKNLNNRLCRHLYDYKRFKDGKGDYITSFDIIKDGDVKIILLEEYSCDSISELLNREKFYIENNRSVNKIIPARSKKDSNKKYREENKKKISDQRKDYRLRNKEKINEKKICECGGKYTWNNKSIHFRSLKHIKFIDSKITN